MSSQQVLWGDDTRVAMVEQLDPEQDEDIWPRPAPLATPQIGRLNRIQREMQQVESKAFDPREYEEELNENIKPHLVVEDYDIHQRRYAGLVPVDAPPPPPPRRTVPKAISHRWALEQRAKPQLNEITQEHMEIDSRAIHTVLCAHLPQLRNPAPVAGSSEERERRRRNLERLQQDLTETCSSTASNFLLLGQYELAVPAALQALRFGVAVHGNNSPGLVTAYLQLGEASVGLGKLKQAEEYLALARWLVLKNADTAPSLRSRLHRFMGRLLQEQGRTEESVREYAHGVYWASVAHGPTSVVAIDAAAQLGAALLGAGNAAGALSTFATVVRAWDTIASQEDSMETAAELAAGCVALERIAAVRQQWIGAQSAETAEAFLVLGMLLERNGKMAQAAEALQSAMAALNGVPTSDATSLLAARVRQAQGRLRSAPGSRGAGSAAPLPSHG